MVIALWSVFLSPPLRGIDEQSSLKDVPEREGGAVTAIAIRVCQAQSEGVALGRGAECPIDMEPPRIVPLPWEMSLAATSHHRAHRSRPTTLSTDSRRSDLWIRAANHDQERSDADRGRCARAIVRQRRFAVIECRAMMQSCA